MKFSELSKYCESIEIDCDQCEHTAECRKMTEHVEDLSPAGVKKRVEEDTEF